MGKLKRSESCIKLAHLNKLKSLIFHLAKLGYSVKSNYLFVANLPDIKLADLIALILQLSPQSIPIHNTQIRLEGMFFA